MTRMLAVPLALLALTACAATPSNTAAVHSRGAATRLLLVDAGAAGREISTAGFDTTATGFDPGKEAALVAQCGARPAIAPAAELAKDFLALFLRPVVALIVGKIDAAIQKELEEYTAAYGASTFTQTFYAASDPRLELGATCFRFTRVVGPADAPVIALDLVGQLRLAEDGGALLLRPLRLYVGERAAKGDPLSIAVSLAAESVWLDGASRKSEKTFDVVLVKQVVSGTGASAHYYLPPEDDGLAGFVPVKLPPWTRRTAHEGATGNVTLTLTVAEAGKAPGYLKAIAEIFSDKKDDVSKLITKALEPLLGLD